MIIETSEVKTATILYVEFSSRHYYGIVYYRTPRVSGNVNLDARSESYWLKMFNARIQTCDLRSRQQVRLDVLNKETFRKAVQLITSLPR